MPVCEAQAEPRFPSIIFLPLIFCLNLFAVILLPFQIRQVRALRLGRSLALPGAKFTRPKLLAIESQVTSAPIEAPRQDPARQSIRDQPVHRRQLSVFSVARIHTRGH